jgi:hypothetical protein
LMQKAKGNQGIGNREENFELSVKEFLALVTVCPDGPVN